MPPRKSPHLSPPPPTGDDYIYVRVSKDKNKGRRRSQYDIVSPDTQREVCLDWLRRRQGDCPDDRIISDIDYSGYRIAYHKRPGLMALMHLAEEGKVRRIIVWKWSRLGRRAKEVLEILDMLESHGVVVHSATEDIDVSTPAGRLLRNQMITYAQFFAEDHSRVVSENKAIMREMGRDLGGHANFGFRWEDKRLVPDDPPEAGAVAEDRIYTAPHARAAFDMVLRGGGVHAVWDYFYQAALPAPRGNKFWDKSQIRLMLRNPIYTRLIGEDKWRMAQENLDRFVEVRNLKIDLTPHILTGLISCCTDHAPDGRDKPVPFETVGTFRRARRYVCAIQHRLSKSKTVCTNHQLDAKSLEHVLVQHILGLAENEELAQELHRAHLRDANRGVPDLQRRKKELERQKSELHQALATIEDDFYRPRPGRPKIDEARFDAMNSRYLEELAVVNHHLTSIDLELRHRQRGLMDVKAYCDSLRQVKQAWEGLTQQEKGMALRQVIRRIIVHQDHLEADFFYHTARLVPTEIKRNTMFFDYDSLILNTAEEEHPEPNPQNELAKTTA